ncbi:hypothetical protein HYPBUDRAFT_104835 [Hyphopichia burtonii NRRL Y-1933]|uniref:High osmolarity signaling protein SHO1 n=1 Tax=Hyphopichia burtonii NRRL Y-1933 TaxID=984485 RepID=A0A1E4RMH9_9ASCO|nr:hypothetical protein HYPBUDRAFT_104835 [Hyphopichia burtonii NRRL Y-1933]ODV68459.1 hypothetical protein HYPBUDRAFT_104835 [Hyphopichia burtonii NRRL Y-1933]
MSFSISNFLSDPFAITTVSFGLISAIIAIAGAGAANQSDFPHFSWWGIVYQIVVIIIILLLYLCNTIELYKFTLVGLISIAFIYNTNSINWLIYTTNDSGFLCCAAGCILLSIVNLIWILYFGGHPESPTNQFIDSFSLKSHNHGHLNSNHNLDDDNYVNVNPVTLPHHSSSSNLQVGSPQFQDNNLRQSQLTTNNRSTNTPYMSSSQLNGLENFSSSDVRDLNNSNPPNSFRYKAKALYSYDANPEDINEISFFKDEILEVEDIEGKWWQARRSNGQVGICPSNYVKLLD